MKRDDAVYLRHILDASVLIGRYMAGLDELSFSANSLVLDAVVRQLEVIGEASKHISQDLRARHPEVPWHVASAMRNKLVHDYMGVEPAIVWNTATTDLPEFAAQIRAVLRDIDRPTN
jgi:uncharacterized protein with HEPN domain